MVNYSDRDHLLFTPGPLTTSLKVKQAMLHDLGSRDSSFLELTQDIRRRLLRVAGVSEDQFTTILLQGSGTYGVESVLTTVVPQDQKILIVSNGAYGSRMVEMARVAKLGHTALTYAENEKPRIVEIAQALEADPQIKFVAMVHCETTSGIFNPIDEVGALCKKKGLTYIVDAMSSFGAVPISFEKASIDFLISSANKCIEGVPGFSFIIANRTKLIACEGRARSLSLDLYSQWKALETAGEFRYTPPIQTILAFQEALNELDEEGGVEKRSARYQENFNLLVQGMRKLGFKTYLPADECGYIITSFEYLQHPKFNYQKFYERVRTRNFVIYSGKVSNAQCFRVGNIGRVFPADIKNLLSSIRESLVEMEIL